MIISRKPHLSEVLVHFKNKNGAFHSPRMFSMFGKHSTRFFIFAWLALLLFEAVWAGCPNSCNGNGYCFQSKCVCFDGFGYSPDCSQRTCPAGPAWADKAYAVDQAHTNVSAIADKG